MKTLIHDYDIKREGIEIERELDKTQELISLICSRLRKGKNIEVIVEEDYSVVYAVSLIQVLGSIVICYLNLFMNIE